MSRKYNEYVDADGNKFRIPENVQTDPDSPFFTEEEEKYTDKIIAERQAKQLEEQNLRLEEMDFDEQIAFLLKGIRVGEDTVTQRKKKLQEKGIKPVRACAYGRVSTKHDEQEASLLTQHKLFHKFVEENEKEGYVIVEEIYDQRTGTLAEKRPRFLKMINRALNGDFEVLLFKDCKRMCRNTEDFLHLTEKLARVGVGCIFISDGRVNTLTAKRETLTVLGMIAESHSNGLHDSVSIAKKIAMERELGRVPSYCYGYDKPAIKDSTVMLINEEEATLVKELFIRYAINKEGVATICDDWRSRGIKSKTGQKVSITMLNRMLDNKLYIGVLEMGWSSKQDVRDDRKFSDEPAVVRYRPDLRIIPDELFAAAQEIRQARKAGKRPAINRRSALTSKIQCACCGKNYKKYYNTPTGNRHLNVYYKCTTKKNGKRAANVTDCSNKSTFRRDEILDAVATYFKYLVNINPDDLRDIIYNALSDVIEEVNSKSNSDSLDLEIEEVTEEYKRTVHLYKKGLIDDDSDIMELKKRLEDLRSKQNILKQTTVSKSDINEMVDVFLTNINEFVDISVKDIDKASDETNVRFNSLFDSIIATTDGRLIFNMNIYGKGEKYYNVLNGMSDKKPVDTLLEEENNDICTLVDTDRSVCRYLCGKFGWRTYTH